MGHGFDGLKMMDILMMLGVAALCSSFSAPCAAAAHHSLWPRRLRHAIWRLQREAGNTASGRRQAADLR